MFSKANSRACDYKDCSITYVLVVRGWTWCSCNNVNAILMKTTLAGIGHAEPVAGLAIVLGILSSSGLDRSTTGNIPCKGLLFGIVA